ncbi:MAG: hypothetical protein S4CHLAM20_01980 [Chlamydiia bacterium]|nr:hypothetical protein [Chlamydiia bacterium]|tara:strand:+ start:1812 stop:1916 length:105 start_codon:yes stop_codon:yes gene_type:complete
MAIGRSNISQQIIKAPSKKKVIKKKKKAVKRKAK